MPDRKTSRNEGEASGKAMGDACPPDGRQAGPPREAGGTTGEGNLAPMQANRTGGATGGVGDGDDDAERPARAGTIPPDA